MTVAKCFAPHARADSLLSSPFRVFPWPRDMAVAFREVADRTARFDRRLRAAGNALRLSGAQPPPNRISLETQDRRFALLSSCLKRHWDCRLPSLAGSRLPLPKRFYRGLVEVRVSRGCDNPNIRNVSLPIERQSETACPTLPRQR